MLPYDHTPVLHIPQEHPYKFYKVHPYSWCPSLFEERKEE
jgi:hypothetical protein